MVTLIIFHISLARFYIRAVIDNKLKIIPYIGEKHKDTERRSIILVY
jgi:hypothetical protein